MTTTRSEHLGPVVVQADSLTDRISITALRGDLDTGTLNGRPRTAAQQEKP